MTLKTLFFQILKYSNQLKKQNKSLRKEDPEQFEMFLHIVQIIERNMHYEQTDDYLDLVNEFLSDETVKDFPNWFVAFHDKVQWELEEMMQNESEELGDFLRPTRKKLKFDSSIAELYNLCLNWIADSSWCDKEDLKTQAEELLVELQKMDQE